MSQKIIHYAVLSNDDATLERQGNLLDKNFVFSKCPVVKHKLNRTFVCNSPIDFSLEIDKESKKILCSNPEYLIFDDDHLSSAQKPVIQLSFSKFLFWTDEKNIWFEFNDHPMTSYTNNFISINGWFNISNWTRATSITAIFVDEKKPIIIKKGDPLFRVSFHPPNLNDGIILKEEKNHEEIKKKLNVMNNNKRNFIKGNMLRKLFSDSKSNSKSDNSNNTDRVKKCPFEFLHK